MSKMIQIRNVPDDLHRRLKAQAAQAGMSLSDFLLAEARVAAARPSLPELLDRLAALEPIEVDEPPDVTIRRARDAD